MALLPTFLTLRWTKVFENSTDYSVQNTTRQALFLPTSREAKYKAKQAIDSFFVRFGDMLQAGVVYVGVQLALTTRGFAIVNIDHPLRPGGTLWHVLCHNHSRTLCKCAVQKFG